MSETSTSVDASRLDVLVPTCDRAGALAVTLAGLVGQAERDFRVVVSDQGEQVAADDPLVRATTAVLRRRDVVVEHGRHLPRAGMAEHRRHLLAQAERDWVLFLDDDVLLEPGALTALLDAAATLGCGVLGMAMQGWSFLHDVRPHEQGALEVLPADGPVPPERVRRGGDAWERWRLHNAANLSHVADRLAAEGQVPDRGWLPYRVAWLAGCVLLRRDVLVETGGFDFADRLPPAHAGEDVVVQLRVAERAGAAGLVPSRAWHLELPTRVPDRRADAYDLVLEADDAASGDGGGPDGAAGAR